MAFKAITIINGKVDSNDCVILDSGINFGRGVFETIDIVGNKPLFLDKHCERLKNGLDFIGVKNSQGLNFTANRSILIDKNVVDCIDKYIIDCIEKFNIVDCALKLLVTQENIIISTREKSYTQSKHEEGLSAKISELKRNPHSHITFYKTINYTDNIIEKERAAKEGYDEVIFLNVYNKLSEGSVSNIFFVKNHKIYTPEIGCGLLNGIVRSWVIENFTVEEGQYSIENLFDADEVFVTNSLMGIMKVKKIGEVGKYENGEVYKRVRELYLDYRNL